MKTPSRLFRFTILFAMLLAALAGTSYTQAKSNTVEPTYFKGDSMTCDWGELILNSDTANALNGAVDNGSVETVKMLVCAYNTPKVPNVPGTPSSGADKVTLSPCPADGTTFDLPIPSAIQRLAKGGVVLAGQACPAVPPVVADNNGNAFGTNKVKVTLCPAGTTSDEMPLPRANNLISSGAAVALGSSCPVVADADTSTEGDAAANDTALDPIVPAVVNITLPNDNWSSTTDEVTGDVTILNPALKAPPGQQPADSTTVTVEVKVNTPTITVPACDKPEDKNEPKKCP
ncbi:MAG: hypothetical protein WC851_02080 [Candidatus Shapirobacteria bacterium]